MLKFGDGVVSHLETWKFVDGNYALSRFGLVLNSAINSFIYCCCGSNFRKEFKKMFALCCTSRKRRNAKKYTSSTTCLSNISQIATGNTNSAFVTVF